MASFAHIAIIDDDEHVLNATGRLLAMQSFEVSKFTSAEAFLESPDLCNLSCVVTDLRLPGMHGTALLARLRELGCAVPLVFITAHPNDIARHAATGDAVCVLRKPFDSDQLMKCLERALAKRS